MMRCQKQRSGHRLRRFPVKKHTALCFPGSPLSHYTIFLDFPKLNVPKLKKPRTQSKQTQPVDQAPLDWRELLQNRNAVSTPESVAEKEARIKQDEEKRQERLQPVPFNAERLKHYREGSLVSDADNRIGYLRGFDNLQPMFHPLN